MSKPGPRPTPTKLKLLRGNPGKQKLNMKEPQPDPVTPICPKWIDPYAKAAWRELVPQLRKMNVLTKIDRQALTNYCQVWARWRKAEEFLLKHGEALPVKDDAGKLKYLCQFPQVSIARNLLTILNRYQGEFGLTPAARTSIKVNEADKPEQSDLERFMGGA